MAADYRTLLGLVREFLQWDLGRGPGTNPPEDLLERARAAIAPSKPKNDVKILHSWPEDPCCAGRLTRAALAGDLDKNDAWSCPKCGAQWQAHAAGDIKRWEPVNDLEVFHLP